MRDLPDIELLRRARRDPEAFVAFYDRHERPLLAFLVRATGQPELAVDVAAETFAALLTAVGRGDDLHEPRGWLYAVARRKVVDAHRRGRTDDDLRRKLGMERVELSDASIARITSLGVDGGEDAVAALAGLPDDQRAAVEARVIDELSYDEIAGRLAISPAVARKRVSRGLARMRTVLQKETP